LRSSLSPPCWPLPQVFTTAAADEHKNIVTLAFQTIEKIVRDYFSYITETETSTFTDCVNCLIAFTNSRFNKDVSLNAIAFLRFCALKLAEGELGQPVHQPVEGGAAAEHKADRPMAPFTDRDDHLYFWFPLLAGESGAAGRHRLRNSCQLCSRQRGGRCRRLWTLFWCVSNVLK
jgi:brefeldin A-inhibited guanine nucleotide-exchange protein